MMKSRIYYRVDLDGGKFAAAKIGFDIEPRNGNNVFELRRQIMLAFEKFVSQYRDGSLDVSFTGEAENNNDIKIWLLKMMDEFYDRLFDEVEFYEDGKWIKGKAGIPRGKLARSA